MRGYFEIEQKHVAKDTGKRIKSWKDGVINLCTVTACNDPEMVGRVVQVDDVMRDCIEQRGSGRVIDIAGRTLFLDNPTLQSCGQQGGI